MPNYSTQAAPLQETTHITPDMAKILAPGLMVSLTEKSIRENTRAVDVWLGYKNASEGTKFKPAAANTSHRELAEQIVNGGAMDHVAIRSIKLEKGVASEHIALNGMVPFKDRMGAIGFTHRAPELDSYKFPNGVEGVHLELHPDLMQDCSLNKNGSAHAPDYAKIFMSEMYVSDIPESYCADLVAALKKGKDTMTAQELKLLERVRAGENLGDKDVAVLGDGLFRFMTADFAPIPSSLAEVMTQELAKHSEASTEYKKAEYSRSRVFSTTNHCAYNTRDLPELFKQMGEVGFAMIPVQHMSFLRQFGVFTTAIDKQWLELIERQLLTNEQGKTVDYNGNESELPYVARGFRPKNAYTLFSAGNEK